MHAVILAGGKGTRLRPLTDTRPKPLLPFAGDPFATGLLRRLAAAGCRNATFLVGPDATPFTPLKDLGERLGIPVDVVTEPQPLDTAGAARDVLRRRTDGPFLVCNGDILTDLDYAAVVAEHRRRAAVATIALTRVEDTATFGVVDIADDGRVQRFVEKPPPGTLDADTVNAGTYVLSSAAFDESPSSGPLSFERDVFPTLLAAGAPVLGVPGGAFWMDLGTPQRYLAGHRAVLAGDCAWPLGPDFRRVGSSLVHARAQLDEGAELGEHVVVCEGARIAAGAAVSRSALFEGAYVGAGASVVDSIIGEQAHVVAGAQVHREVIAPNEQGA